MILRRIEMLIIFYYYLHFKEEFIYRIFKNIFFEEYIYSKDFSFIIIRITLSANRKFCARYLCNVFTCCDNMSLLCVSRSSVAILFHSLVTSFLLLTYGRFDFTFAFYVAVEKLGK